MATGIKQKIERRRHPRALERVSLAITESGGEVSAETKNISASGAYCNVDRFIAPMTKLDLRFELPNSKHQPVRIHCRGVVVRVEPVIENADRGKYNIAVFFNDLAERDRKAIANFVRQRIPQSAT